MLVERLSTDVDNAKERRSITEGAPLEDQAWNRPAHTARVSHKELGDWRRGAPIGYRAKGLDRSIFKVTVLCLYGGGELTREHGRQ